MDAPRHPEGGSIEQFEANFASNILPRSAEMPAKSPIVSGFEFRDVGKRNITVAELLCSFAGTGIQASNCSDVIDVINYIRSWKVENGTGNAQLRNEVLLGCTSNLISSGVREQIRWLVENKHVTAVVVTAGGVEEDIIKCLGPTYRDSFEADDAQLYSNHINRIGNLRVPNNNYVKFEDWLTPILRKMLDEQELSQRGFDELKTTVLWEQARGEISDDGTRSTDGRNMTRAQISLHEMKPLIWTPSTFIQRLGKEINNESSFVYWAYKNNIPIFCPALSDGSIGDIVSAFEVRSRARPPFPVVEGEPAEATPEMGLPDGTVLKGWPIPNSPQSLIADIWGDIDRLNTITRNCALYGGKMGAIVLGAGLVKHHVMNACLQGGGADAAVYINTSSEYDGSDSGARPSEAVSWGKLKAGAPSAKLFCDVSIALCLIICGTWALVEDDKNGQNC